MHKMSKANDRSSNIVVTEEFVLNTFLLIVPIFDHTYNIIHILSS